MFSRLKHFEQVGNFLPNEKRSRICLSKKNCRLSDMNIYSSIYLSSAALPSPGEIVLSTWDLEIVLTQVTFQTKHLPCFQGMRAAPPGRFSSSRHIPTGSRCEGTPQQYQSTLNDLIDSACGHMAKTAVLAVVPHEHLCSRFQLLAPTQITTGIQRLALLNITPKGWTCEAVSHIRWKQEVRWNMISNQSLRVFTFTGVFEPLECRWRFWMVAVNCHPCHHSLIQTNQGAVLFGGKQNTYARMLSEVSEHEAMKS